MYVSLFVLWCSLCIVCSLLCVDVCLFLFFVVGY